MGLCSPFHDFCSDPLHPFNAFLSVVGHTHDCSATHVLALWNNCIHGPSSSQISGCHEYWTVRNARSGWGIIMVTRPSVVVNAVSPPWDPFGFAGYRGRSA